jgi:hypothetical protein
MVPEHKFFVFRRGPSWVHKINFRILQPAWYRVRLEYRRCDNVLPVSVVVQLRGR